MNANQNRPAPSQNEQHFTPVMFNYQGQNIGFKTIKGVIMLNATQMAKAFNKRCPDWLKLQSTDEFLNALKVSQNDNMHTELFEKEKPLVQVVNGGHNRGTWMQEDVALEFSRWLSPHFAIWTNKHIKELLLKGATSIKREKKGYPSLPPKRNHNRLTQARLVAIMSDVVRIEDKELRMRLTQKLGL